VWRRWFSQAGVDGLMSFTQKFAIPCLLFTAISRLDLGQSFDWRLLLSFYVGASSGFALGLFGARLIFGRTWEDAVAIGFCCLFSNSLLLGLPITERAYGPDALEANYAIVAVHAPFCYTLGIAAMEIARAKGGGVLSTSRRIVQSVFKNALVIGISLGLIVNLGGITVPGTVADAVGLMARAALPAALFGLGGVLYRYRPEGDMRTIAFVCCITLILHPSIVWLLGSAFDLPQNAFRSAVLTSSMAPGVNAYVFSNMYGRAKRVAASSVLMATAGSLFTVWIWLMILGH
ncbi:MAG TPA: AEC family transporter, partial [Paracoccaceae bacterium]|nr:AEC family transporter [Paracoccaceae bacterium]